MIVDNADIASPFTCPTDKSKLAIIVTRLHLRMLYQNFFSQSQNGLILIITHNRNVVFRVTEDSRDITTVDPMNEELAMDLLTRSFKGFLIKMVQRGSYMPSTTYLLLLPKLQHLLVKELHT
jgi:hypothetical protein